MSGDELLAVGARIAKADLERAREAKCVAGFPVEVDPNTECSANIGGDWHARETWDGPCVNCGRALLPDACEACGDRDYELTEITNEHDRRERVCPKCKRHHDRLAALELI